VSSLCSSNSKFCCLPKAEWTVRDSYLALIGLAVMQMVVVELLNSLSSR
jgi:hypothetical protein